ncbi:hypothetical protein MMPV_007429 [Pyropia vietnamensis]
MRVRPFAAVRPVDTAAAERVACPPYDVVSAADAVAAAAASPDTFLRVVLPECGLPDGGGSGPDAGRRRHEAASAALARLIADGLLVREAAPALYVYELSLDGGSGGVGGGDGSRHTQRGLVATVSVDDYQAGVIRVHEDTRAAKEAERMALTDAVNAHTGPVFLTHPDGGAPAAGSAAGDGIPPGGGGPVSAALDAAVSAAGAPLFSFTDGDACGPVTHSVWRVDGPSSTALAAAYAAHVPAAYVADGHHRAASAVAVGVARQKRAAVAAAASDEPAPANGIVEAGWFLAVLFPVSQMRLLPYHRVVRALPDGTSAESFLAALSAVCDVASSSAAAAAAATAAPAVPILCVDGAARAPEGEASLPTPPRATVVHAYLRRQWYRVTLPALPSSRAPGSDASPSSCNGQHGAADLAAALDCARLQAVVLGPLLGIEAPRTDPRMEFVGGDGGVPALQAAVDGLDKAAAAAVGGGGGERPAAVAFAMAPVAMADLLAVSDAGGRMPPKSTWFSPKLRSGLFVHTF